MTVRKTSIVKLKSSFVKKTDRPRRNTRQSHPTYSRTQRAMQLRAKSQGPPRKRPAGRTRRKAMHHRHPKDEGQPSADATRANFRQKRRKHK